MGKLIIQLDEGWGAAIQRGGRNAAYIKNCKVGYEGLQAVCET